MSDRKYDPQQPYKLWLDHCAEIPAAERPTFTYRRLSGREQLELLDIWEGLSNESTGQRAGAASLFTGAGLGLLGWDTQTDIATGEVVPFKPEDLDRIIDTDDAAKLIVLRLSHSRTSDDDKKKSE